MTSLGVHKNNGLHFLYRAENLQGGRSFSKLCHQTPLAGSRLGALTHLHTPLVQPAVEPEPLLRQWEYLQNARKRDKLHLNGGAAPVPPFVNFISHTFNLLIHCNSSCIQSLPLLALSAYFFPLKARLLESEGGEGYDLTVLQQQVSMIQSQEWNSAPRLQGKLGQKETLLFPFCLGQPAKSEAKRKPVPP